MLTATYWSLGFRLELNLRVGDSHEDMLFSKLYGNLPLLDCLYVLIGLNGV